MTKEHEHKGQANKAEKQEICCQKMGIGEVFKKAWAVLSKDIKFFAIVWLIGLGIMIVIGIIAFIFMMIFGVSAGVFSGLFSGKMAVSNYASVGLLTGGILILTLLIALAAIVVGSWVNGAYVYAVYNALHNKKVEPWECYKLAWKRVWTFVGLGILTSLMVGIGLMLLIIPGIIIGIYLFYAFYLVVVENLGAMQAISRSFKLAGKNWLEIFLVVLIVFMAAAILSMIPIVNLVVNAVAMIFLVLCAGVLYSAVKK